MFIQDFSAFVRTRAGNLCVLSLLAAGGMLGCGSPDEQAASYHARGVVLESNGTGGDLRVTIHHEAIDKFKDRDGKESTMASMSMNFGVADSVPKTAFVKGDEIAFDFDLRWSKTPPLLITKVEKLPADTKLVLSHE